MKNILLVVLLFMFNIGRRLSSPPPPPKSNSISQGVNLNNRAMYNYNSRGYFMSSNSSSSKSQEPDDHRNNVIATLNSQLRASVPYLSSHRVDIESRSSYSTIPIIMPAAAQLSAHLPDNIYDEDEFDDDDDYMDTKRLHANKRPKKKKNFSQLAKDLLAKTPPVVNSGGRGVRPNPKSDFDLPKAARSYTTPAKKTRTKVELNGYCGYRTDGLYEDPNECESFIICFAGRTFRTKCAYGTSWNHIRKECDFPEKVDCERKASTTTEEPTTPIPTEPLFTTTPVLAPKLSAYTVRNNHRVGDGSGVHSMDRNVLNNLRLNILLTLILIPTVIFIVTLIGCTLWYWRRKFKLERHRLDFSNSVKLAAAAANNNKNNINKETSSAASITIIENTATVTSNDAIVNNKPKKCEGKRAAVAELLRKLTCLSRLCDCMTYHGQFKPKLIVSCAGGGGPNHSSHHRLSNINNIDLVRGRITSPSSSSSSKTPALVVGGGSEHDQHISQIAPTNKILDQSITVKYPQQQQPQKAKSSAAIVVNTNNHQHQQAPFKQQQQQQHLSLVDVCNHHAAAASQSHVTLSSHFEENNWDYNFATRGLYLSQPWVRGRYTHTMGSESMAATSGVLTLDPTTELSLEINQPTAAASGGGGGRFIDIYVETGGSDTDGYYA